jgi:hypothetical protein
MHMAPLLPALACYSTNIRANFQSQFLLHFDLSVVPSTEQYVILKPRTLSRTTFKAGSEFTTECHARISIPDRGLSRLVWVALFPAQTRLTFDGPIHPSGPGPCYKVAGLTPRIKFAVYLRK